MRLLSLHFPTTVLATVVGVIVSLAAIPGHAADKERWSYGGATGPAKWAGLDPSYEMCSRGETQTPIDIPAKGPREGDLPSLLIDFQPSPLKVIDTGHTIQVNYAPGSYMRVASAKYELLRIQFHKPGEEKIAGKGHDMSAHLMLRAPDGKLGVVAVLLDAGAENKFIKSVWDNLPRDKGKENAVDAVMINAADLIPKNKGYYTFSGSLNTPPCTEDVTWFLFKTPVTLSGDQIARFARIYPMNARPVQAVNGRDIQVNR